MQDKKTSNIRSIFLALTLNQDKMALPAPQENLKSPLKFTITEIRGQQLDTSVRQAASRDISSSQASFKNSTIYQRAHNDLNNNNNINNTKFSL